MQGLLMRLKILLLTALFAGFSTLGAQAAHGSGAELHSYHQGTIAASPSTIIVAVNKSKIESRKKARLLRKFQGNQAKLKRMGTRRVALPAGLSKATRSKLNKIAQRIKRGKLPAAKRSWAKVVRSLHKKNIDIDTVTTWVVRESHSARLKDLSKSAEKVRFHSEQKKKVREHVRSLRNKTRNWPRGKHTVTVKSLNLSPYRPGLKAPALTIGRPVTFTKKSDLEDWLEELSTVGDDAQLANVELQKMLQKQQQTMQMMSNISKMLHDTAMAIIRKIGG